MKVLQRQKSVTLGILVSRFMFVIGYASCSSFLREVAKRSNAAKMLSAAALKIANSSVVPVFGNFWSRRRIFNIQTDWSICCWSVP